MWEPNELQQKILLKLLTSEELRYSEIKPKNIENDLFNYHLQFLVKKALISKANSLYSLTFEGLKFLEELKPISRAYGFVASYRVSVLYIILNKINSQLHVLVQKRTRKPFLGNVGLPSGKVLKGELIEDAASRVCFKETGFTCSFKKIGMLRSLRYYNNTLFSDGFWHICVSNKINNLDESKIEKHGINEWVTIDKAISLETNSSTRSDYVINILKSLMSDPFKPRSYFVEEKCNLTKL